MKPPTHYFLRARECRRYAIALAVICIVCAIAFACIDRPSLTGIEGLLPLFLASFAFATGWGAVKEIREWAWWREMGDREAAFQPMERI